MFDVWLTPPAQEPAPWSHRVVIFVLVLLGCTAMLSSSAIADTARDVYNAWQISTGSHFPLEGPFMASAFHSGPAWFYILSLPLLFTSSWTALSFWVGLLTGMKYVLAYACGSRLGNRNFGLIWAALLALPNWTSINYLIFSHTNLVETLVLASFYCLIRWQQGEVRWFPAMCLALSLGLHAHPTTLAIALSISPLVIFAMLRGRLSWRWLLLGAAVALIPWVPYLISQQLQQWPDLQHSSEHISTLSFVHNTLGVHHLAWGALVDGPLLMLKTFFGLEGFWLMLCFSLIVLLHAGGLGLAAWSTWKTGNWRIPVALLFVTIVSMLFVASLRSITQYYLILLVYPSFYGIVAWGWSQCMEPLKQRMISTVSMVAMASLAAFTLANAHIGQMGNAVTPLRALLDVRTHATDEFNDSVIFPAWARDELADFVCDSGAEPVFHGYASMVLDMSYGLEIRMRCPEKGFYIGGTGNQQHYLGVSERDAELLGVESPLKIGPMHLLEPSQVLSPDHLLQVPAGDVYPPYQYIFEAAQSQQYHFSSNPEEWLVVTNLFHFWMPDTVLVQLNGESIEPTLKTSLQSFFFCEDCSENETAHWTVTIDAARPELVEVVSFRNPQAP